MPGKIHNLYKYCGKCDNQQQYKSIIEEDILSPSEGFTNNSPISLCMSIPVNNTSARKSLHQFS